MTTLNIKITTNRHNTIKLKIKTSRHHDNDNNNDDHNKKQHQHLQHQRWYLLHTFVEFLRHVSDLIWNGR